MSDGKKITNRFVTERNNKNVIVKKELFTQFNIRFALSTRTSTTGHTVKTKRQHNSQLKLKLKRKSSYKTVEAEMRVLRTIR